MDSRAPKLLAALGFGAIPTVGVMLWMATAEVHGAGKHQQDAANTTWPCCAGTSQGPGTGGGRARYISLGTGETGGEPAQVVAG